MNNHTTNPSEGLNPELNENTNYKTKNYNKGEL